MHSKIKQNTYSMHSSQLTSISYKAPPTSEYAALLPIPFQLNQKHCNAPFYYSISHITNRLMPAHYTSSEKPTLIKFEKLLIRKPFHQSKHLPHTSNLTSPPTPPLPKMHHYQRQHQIRTTHFMLILIWQSVVSLSSIMKRH